MSVSKEGERYRKGCLFNVSKHLLHHQTMLQLNNPHGRLEIFFPQTSVRTTIHSCSF